MKHFVFLFLLGRVYDLHVTAVTAFVSRLSFKYILLLIFKSFMFVYTKLKNTLTAHTLPLYLNI